MESNENELRKLQDHIDHLYNDGYLSSDAYDDITLAIIRQLAQVKKAKIKLPGSKGFVSGGIGNREF